MQSGGRVALGLSIGYLLGRSRKMKLALALAGLGAAGKLGGSPGGVVGKVSSALGSVPVVSQLTEQVRGELAEAVKAAAMTAASNRIDSLSGRIRDGAAKSEGEAVAKSDGKPEARAGDKDSAGTAKREDVDAAVPKPRRGGASGSKAAASGSSGATSGGPQRTARTSRGTSSARG